MRALHVTPTVSCLATAIALIAVACPARAQACWRHELQKLTASDPTASNRFGYAVSIDGNRAVVGKPYDDDVCPEDPWCNSGSAYVFRRDDNGTPGYSPDDVWIEEAKLNASDAAAGEKFGISVSISGNRIVVGAYLDSTAGPASGAISDRRFGPVAGAAGAAGERLVRRAGAPWLTDRERDPRR